MTLSSGSLVSQGEETPDEYARPRPTEKYWEDYEDWKTHHPSAIDSFDTFREAAEGKLLTVFLDYDGTISDIVRNPDEAYMTDEMRTAVSRVASLYPTAIISGRSREKVYDFVQLPQLYYAGSHGLDIVGPKTQHETDHVELHQPAPKADRKSVV